MIVSLEKARLHCKSDPADDDLLQDFIDAAEARAAALINRNLYPTAAAMSAAVAALPTMLQTAGDTYEAAIAAAQDIERQEDRDFALLLARTAYDKVRIDANMTAEGMVVNKDLFGMILLIIGDMYIHREDNVEGAINALPNGVERIAYRYRRVGPL